MERAWISDASKKLGERISVAGFVHNRRDHGKLIFIDLRDRSGLLQVVFRPDAISGSDPKRLRAEWVVSVTGEIKARPEHMENSDIATGSVELVAETLSVLAEAKTPPFDLADEKAVENVSEDVRLRYRYLDIRRPEMLQRLAKRHDAILFIRNFLSDRGFLEIETPILTKSTPEGARDYLVPARLHRGSFYALPQSPQQYKQLLMVAGVERYFQIARCFRDEDTRGDRQPEFTQLDLEMSFVEQNDILSLIEDLFTSLVRKRFPQKRMTMVPWPRLDYDDVVAQYRTDRPDLRQNPNNPDELAFAWILNFPLFEKERTPTGHLAPSHHMFTAPRPEDLGKLEVDPASVRSLQHDLVLNGWEVGGGSVRIHDPKIQQQIFRLIGFTPQQEDYFAHMLEAFRYGAPPHGGIAPGIDRILMILLGQPNIREVIAFPKTGDGRELMMDAPAPVADEQLKELGLHIEGEAVGKR